MLISMFQLKAFSSQAAAPSQIAVIKVLIKAFCNEIVQTKCRIFSDSQKQQLH